MLEMPIRLARADDLSKCVEFDASYTTDYVWQMDAQMSSGQIQVTFSHLRLPRSMRVDYPRTAQMLAADWPLRDGVLIAEQEGHMLGYVSLTENAAQRVVHIGDLVVQRRYRRTGVGSQLVSAALRWARERTLKQLIVEVQTKNHPAIEFLNKLGFSFCGFNDQHYLNRDIALFFSRTVR